MVIGRLLCTGSSFAFCFVIALDWFECICFIVWVLLVFFDIGYVCKVCLHVCMFTNVCQVFRLGDRFLHFHKTLTNSKMRKKKKVKEKHTK
jgi:hypothetical protein